MKTRFFFISFFFLMQFSSFAQTGGYIEFNGTNQYMTIPSHADFNITATESFTVSCWVNVLEFKAGNSRFVAKRCQATAIADKSGYELFGANSAAQFYATNTPNAAGNHNNSLSAFPSYTGATNKWTHIAFVVDRSAGKMYQYIDGVAVINSAPKDISPWAVNNAFDVYVGCGIAGTTTGTPANFLHGQMDNLRFYKKALSAAEITADMKAVVTASTPGLVAGYDFENYNGKTAADVTGNHNATLFNFAEPGTIAVTQATDFTGRGNDNEVILKLNVGLKAAEAAKSVVLSMNGTTDINDVESIKIYSTGAVDKFDSRNVASATLLGTGAPASGDITVNLTGNLAGGSNYIWVTYRVKDTAKEGNKVDAEVKAFTVSSQSLPVAQGNPDGAREILLKRKLVFAPGDYSSVSYRIPAICTAADGTLITLTDKRKFNSGDLPGNIDIVCKRSIDGGFTWSEPIMVAQGNSTRGFGDAAIVKANSGKLIALFVGDAGLWGSTPQKPMRTYMSTSSDNGLTWTASADITPQIYGAECSVPARQTWQGLFFGSGHALCTRGGRVMAVVAVREPNMNGLQNYVVYSDDEGATWQVSNRAIQGGDEAKVVELSNGDILMSSRTSGNRLWAKSTDGGVNWGAKNSWTEISGNACDADIIRYTLKSDGYDKNRILHTLPNANDRRNVTMWISYDETATWPIKKTICAGTSAYSSITILPDGTIGVYLEEDGSNPYKMYFLNFSLNWLTDGADSYTGAGTEVVKNPVFTPAGGRYGETQNVTITTPTADASIYYTTDGTTPNKAATLYTAPVQVSQSMTLKAIAIKEGLANSEVISENYIIGWLIPAQNREVGNDRYVVSAVTEGADVNLNYTATTPPSSYYIPYNNEVITAKQGSTFTLKLEGLKNQTDGLQWCQAIILVDWNRDFTFTADERVAIIGSSKSNNGAALLSIAQKITVPQDAYTMKPTRLRVVYTDGWRPTTYADLGEDPVDKGRIYDFDLKIDTPSGIKNSYLSHLTINPNPVKDFLNINFPKVNEYKVALLDLTGKKISATTIFSDKLNMSVKDYPAGVYLVQVNDNVGEQETVRFIKN